MNCKWNRWKFSMRRRTCVTENRATKDVFKEGHVKKPRANKGYWYRDGKKVTS